MNGTLSRPNTRKTVVTLQPLDAGQQLRPVERFERPMQDDRTEGEEIQGGRVLIVFAVGCFLIGVVLMGWLSIGWWVWR